ncbi:acyl carrier protein [Streptomyces zhihengii]
MGRGGHGRPGRGRAAAAPSGAVPDGPGPGRARAGAGDRAAAGLCDRRRCGLVPVRLDVHPGAAEPAAVRPVGSRRGGRRRRPRQRLARRGRTPDAARRLPVAEHQRILLQLVRDAVATVLQYPDPQALDPGRAFKDLGFSSLTAVELRDLLVARTGLQLPTTLVFDYPMPLALVQYLTGQLLGEADRSPRRRRRRRHGPTPGSRSRSWAWPAATPAA